MIFKDNQLKIMVINISNKLSPYSEVETSQTIHKWLLFCDYPQVGSDYVVTVSKKTTSPAGRWLFQDSCPWVDGDSSMTIYLGPHLLPFLAPIAENATY